jgi:hypothetical protein
MLRRYITYKGEREGIDRSCKTKSTAAKPAPAAAVAISHEDECICVPSAVSSAAAMVRWVRLISSALISLVNQDTCWFKISNIVTRILRVSIVRWVPGMLLA